jgi:hypothetical protein
MKSDPELYKADHSGNRDRLKQHGFKPWRMMTKRSIMSSACFCAAGRGWTTLRERVPNNGLPSYFNLMVATDGRGKNWA